MPMKGITVFFQRLVPWAMGAYVVAMFGITLAGVGQLSYYGDELIHLEKLALYLEHGFYAMSGGENSAGELLGIRGHLYSYGPLFTVATHLVAVLFGVETWGTVAYTDAAFAVRHIMVGVFSFLGVFAAGWGVKLVTNSRVWGLATAAVLVSIPMWTGSAMFNLKDTPIATGFTLFTSGLIAVTLGPERTTRSTRVGGWFALFGGTLIFWGVRPGIWPAIVLGFVALWLVRARLSNFTNRKEILRSLVFPASAVLASYAFMAMIYPKLFLNPVVLLYRSLKDTTSFPHDTRVLTDGELLRTPPPWYYLPKWLAAQLPEALLFLLLGATVLAVWVVLKRLFRSTTASSDFAFPAFVFVFIQFAAFPSAAILLKSTIYGGLRQFVFIFPAIAMLTMIALFVVFHTWNLRRVRGLWPGVAGILVASTALTTVIQVQLFPYMGSYFNPTTVAQGVNDRWDVYAWKLAHGELYSQLSEIERVRCTKLCPRIDEFPSTFAVASSDQGDELRYWEFVRFPANRTMAQSANTCDVPVSTVTRPYLGTAITIIEATACPVKASPLDPEPAPGKPTRKWWKSLGKWGWVSASDTGLKSEPGARSALAWTIDAPTAGVTQRFVVTLSAGSGSSDAAFVRATVNGVALSNVALQPGAAAELPIDIGVESFANGPDGLIVVEFEVVDTAGQHVTNQLMVTGIRALR